MREAVIVANARTPLAKSNRGSFNMTRPDDLASHAIRSALAQVPALDPVEIDDVILGCGLPEGLSGGGRRLGGTLLKFLGFVLQRSLFGGFAREIIC